MVMFQFGTLDMTITALYGPTVGYILFCLKGVLFSKVCLLLLLLLYLYGNVRKLKNDPEWNIIFFVSLWNVRHYLQLSAVIDSLAISRVLICVEK